MIAKDCTAQFVEGWDWMVPVPDRGTGIWDDVSITWTGPVLLQVLIQSVHVLDVAQDLARVKGGWIPDDCTGVQCSPGRQMAETLCMMYTALLLQDLYVYSERVTEHTALSDAARVRSEVTLVNNSGRRWQGILRMAVQLDKPEKSSCGLPKQAQPSGQHCQSADPDLDRTRAWQQSFKSMAERGQIRQDVQHWGCGTGKQQRKEPCSTSQQPIHRESALHWTEAVEAPPGRTAVKVKDHVLRNPQLWWPINLGKQARLGNANQHLVLTFCF